MTWHIVGFVVGAIFGWFVRQVLYQGSIIRKGLDRREKKRMDTEKNTLGRFKNAIAREFPNRFSFWLENDARGRTTLTVIDSATNEVAVKVLLETDTGTLCVTRFRTRDSTLLVPYRLHEETDRAIRDTLNRLHV